jgi:phage shock protein E
MIRRAVLPAAITAVLVVVAGSCGSGGGHAGQAAFTRLDPAGFAARMGDPGAHVINVHVPYEGELGDTDAFIPFDRIVGDSRLPADKGAEILLYCRSGHMSQIAGADLVKAGYTNVAHLEGGMQAWEAAGKPLLHNPR